MLLNHLKSKKRNKAFGLISDLEFTTKSVHRSLRDLFVLFAGDPSSGEGLDGDGSQTDDLVDLPHAVTSPVSLDHQRCPALLQCCSTHCFTK